MSSRRSQRLLTVLCALGLGLGNGPTLAHASIWPNAAERAEKQLKDPRVTVRRGAAEKLAELPRAPARRLVVRALEDPDLEVRLRAARLAVELRVSEAPDHVVPWLADPERRLRLAAAQVLAVAPSPRATAGLGRALGDPEVELRVAAALALAAAGKAAVPVLLAHLDDSSPQVRERVIAALGEIGDPTAAVPLIGKIQDGQASVRRSVAKALGELGDARATSALVLVLRDGDEAVRQSAVDALGRLGSVEAVPGLAELSRSDPAENVRLGAVRALARIPAAAAMEAVVAALGDPDLSTAAEEALLGVGQASVPILERCLESSRAGVAGCVRALGHLRPPRGLSMIREAWQRGIVGTEVALAALGDLGDPQGLSLVLERLSDPEPRARRAAIDAASALLDPRQPDGRAVGPIVDALERARRRPAERRALVALLGRTGSSSAVPVLGALVRGADTPGLRQVATEALGRIGPAGQDPILLGALDDERPEVRFAAAVGLRQSASGSTAAKLLDRIERAPEADRLLAMLALGGAIGRSRDARVTERAARLVLASREGERDALIEALGQATAGEPSQRLGELSSSSDTADRAKVAESLAGHPEALRLLRGLAGDPEGIVRAHAIWTLGSVATPAERALLAKALGDRDPTVAANGAAALGRLGARAQLDVERELCRALDDARSYVRANALAGLALVGRRCPDDRASSILAHDPADPVRRAAARLLWRVPLASGTADARALLRCREEDRSGEVAAACAEAPPRPQSGTEPVIVYVIPLGESSPAPRAPFALVRSDGLVRLGLSDRRGAVFERDAPRGRVWLGVPAPLIE